MDVASIRDYIVQTFPDISVVDGTGGSFFFTDPGRSSCFATLATSDRVGPSIGPEPTGRVPVKHRRQQADIRDAGWGGTTLGRKRV